MKITYLGHSCFSFQLNGKDILVDPFITGNPLAKDIDPDQIPADYILITHGHEDHILDAERILKRTDATVISSFEIVSWFNEKGYKGHPMNTGGSYDFEFGNVRTTQAVHSSVLPDGSYGANPMGFVLRNDDHCFYISGDTALTMDMKLIPMVCPPLDFAILPIGDNFTMGYKDIPFAAEFLKCNRIIGCHFDTFDVIKIDREKVIGFFNKNGIDGKILDVGESVEM